MGRCVEKFPVDSNDSLLCIDLESHSAGHLYHDSHVATDLVHFSKASLTYCLHYLADVVIDVFDVPPSSELDGADVDAELFDCPISDDDFSSLKLVRDLSSCGVVGEAVLRTSAA